MQITKKKADRNIRQKSEFDSKENNRRYQSIVDDIPDGYCEMDLTGRVLLVNDVLCQWLQYSREELIGMDFHRLHTPPSAVRAEAACKEIFRDGKPMKSLELNLLTRDATVVSVEASVSLIKGKEDRPIGFRCITRDITERRSMENDLRQAAEKYRNIIETIQDGYIEIDLNGYWTFVNHVVSEHLLYPVDELIGSHYSRFQPDEAGVKRLYQIFRDIYRTGTPVKSLEMPGLRKDGTIGFFDFSVSLMKDSEGKIVGYRCVSRDITERKKMENALRHSEERYRSIIESIADGYIEVDLKGKWTFFNDVVWMRSGYTREELLKADFHMLHTPESAKRSVKAFLKVYQTGEPIRALEVETIRKDGSRGFYELSVSLMKDEHNHPIGFRCISRDISERKKAEALLIKTNRELQEATARANELAAKAEAASIAKSEFLANMSHEIRTPMNGVIGMIGLLLDTQLTEEQRRYAEIVRASGELLLELINNILDFSKIEAKKLDLETIDFDLLTLLDDFAATLAVPAHEKGLEILCSVDPDVPTLLRGDPGRLRQILTNLAGNAVKFTHIGEVVVHVSQAGKEDVRDHVLLRFSVRDTGIGIPGDKIGLLFEKFTQVDASTTRQYGGSGLGLAISKQLCELMGGQIGVKSEVGKGSEFWFTARFDLQTVKHPPEQALPADLQGVRVLIVDDNGTNREILATRLSSWGMRPYEAQDGPRAVQACYQALDENDPFTLAVIDMQMPGMDGETLGRILKADKRLSNLRLVLLTSLGRRGDVKRIQEAGFSAYVAKPIRYQELKTLLSMTVTRSSNEPTFVEPILSSFDIQEIPKVSTAAHVRVLLAEDNPTNQQVALGMLRRLGLQADAVTNGREVLQALERLSYDLVLMDVQMPELDGLETTRTIRAWQTKPDASPGEPLFDPRVRASKIPIIAMTAYAMEEDRERCLASGMNDYVSKPLTPKTLAAALNRWLPKDHQADKSSPVGILENQQGTGKRPTMEHPPQAVYDHSAMMDRLMGDQELVKAVIRRFLEDLPQQVNRLKQSLEAGDAQSVHRQIHSIKGAAANISANSLVSLALRMEKAAAEGNLQSVTESLPALENQFGQFQKAVAEFI